MLFWLSKRRKWVKWVKKDNKSDQIFKLLFFPVSSDSNCATMAVSTFTEYYLKDVDVHVFNL